MTKRYEILVCVANYLPGYKAGGILRTIVNTIDHLGGEFCFKVLTSDRDLGDDTPYPGIKYNQWQRVGDAMVYYLPPKSCTIKVISKVISSTSYDMLYLNGFFDPLLTIKILLCRILGLIPKKPTILAPRGEHSEGPLKLKYFKKVIYIQFAKLAHLYRGLTWQASNESEARDIVRVMGIPPTLVHIACDLPRKAEPYVASVIYAKGDPQTLRCIFLNRLTRKKNLDYALNVLSKVKVKLICDIYGPAEDQEYWDECKAIIRNLPPNVVVNYLGSVSPSQILNTFSRYDLFFFPTRGENYGHVIAESLTAGTPVLISDRTPWRGLQADALGWDIDLSNMDSFVKVIENFTVLGDNERSAQRVHIKEKVMGRLLSPAILEANRQLFLKNLPLVNHASGSQCRGVTPQGNKYQICSNCIMDTSDPHIAFDERGWCDYCRNFHDNILPNWHTDANGESELFKIAEKIKADGHGKPHDCIIGISGGQDSSYAAYIAKEKLGLRPLLFHVDAGWNTQQAVSNIEKLIHGLGLDLYTEVIDWEEMKDLHLAFLRSQIADQDLPQDTAFFSALYKFAEKHKIKYVLTGANYSTECCREPEEWGAYPGIDKTLITDIHRRYGTRPLQTIPIVDIFIYKVYYQRVLGMQIVKPLNYLPYIKMDAEETLEKRFGWEKFQHKHHESRFTRFYEDFWMPKKFGYEKRRAHFSSLILTKQMSRADALKRIAKPEMSEEFLTHEFEYVANKLGLSVSELQDLFMGKNKTYHDYKNKRWLIGLGANAMKILGMEKRLFR